MGVLFIRENAYIRLLLLGNPESIDIQIARSMAQLIDQRLTTGNYSPEKTGPTT